MAIPFPAQIGIRTVARVLYISLLLLPTACGTSDFAGPTEDSVEPNTMLVEEDPSIRADVGAPNQDCGPGSECFVPATPGEAALHSALLEQPSLADVVILSEVDSTGPVPDGLGDSVRNERASHPDHCETNADSNVGERGVVTAGFGRNIQSHQPMPFATDYSSMLAPPSEMLGIDSDQEVSGED